MSQRTIKFQAWHKSREFMSDVLAIHWDTNQVSLAKSENGAIQYLWDIGDVILREYIGLKDKRGKEIWEGDIVALKLDDEKIIEIREVKNGIVKIMDNEGYGKNLVCGFYLADKVGDGDHIDEIELMEVIGNIYEGVLPKYEIDQIKTIEEAIQLLTKNI